MLRAAALAVDGGRGAERDRVVGDPHEVREARGEVRGRRGAAPSAGPAAAPTVRAAGHVARQQPPRGRRGLVGVRGRQRVRQRGRGVGRGQRGVGVRQVPAGGRHWAAGQVPLQGLRVAHQHLQDVVQDVAGARAPLAQVRLRQET